MGSIEDYKRAITGTRRATKTDTRAPRRFRRPLAVDAGRPNGFMRAIRDDRCSPTGSGRPITRFIRARTNYAGRLMGYTPGHAGFMGDQTH